MRGIKTLIMQASTELWRNYATAKDGTGSFILPQKSYAKALNSRLRDNR
ncbi:MAG: hypothetical protein V1702_05140 [Candidatus Woesearchaeota archaeon]